MRRGGGPRCRRLLGSDEAADELAVLVTPDLENMGAKRVAPGVFVLDRTEIPSGGLDLDVVLGLAEPPVPTAVWPLDVVLRLTEPRGS